MATKRKLEEILAIPACRTASECVSSNSTEPVDLGKTRIMARELYLCILTLFSDVAPQSANGNGLHAALLKPQAQRSAVSQPPFVDWCGFPAGAASDGPGKRHLSIEQCERLGRACGRPAARAKDIRSSVWSPVQERFQCANLAPTAEQVSAMPTLFAQSRTDQGGSADVLFDRRTDDLVPMLEDVSSIFKWAAERPQADRCLVRDAVKPLKISTDGARRGLVCYKMTLGHVRLEMQLQPAAERSSTLHQSSLPLLSAEDLADVQSTALKAQQVYSRSQQGSAATDTEPYHQQGLRLMDLALYKTLVDAWTDSQGAPGA